MSAENILPLSYFDAGGEYTGQVGEMRYLVKKEEDRFNVLSWKGPFRFDAVDEKKKRFESFEFSDSGRDQLIEWLNNNRSNIT